MLKFLSVTQFIPGFLRLFLFGAWLTLSMALCSLKPVENFLLYTDNAPFVLTNITVQILSFAHIRQYFYVFCFFFQGWVLQPVGRMVLIIHCIKYPLLVGFGCAVGNQSGHFLSPDGKWFPSPGKRNGLLAQQFLLEIEGIPMLIHTRNVEMMIISLWDWIYRVTTSVAMSQFWEPSSSSEIERLFKGNF